MLQTEVLVGHCLRTTASWCPRGKPNCFVWHRGSGKGVSYLQSGCLANKNFNIDASELSLLSFWTLCVITGVTSYKIKHSILTFSDQKENMFPHSQVRWIQTQRITLIVSLCQTRAGRWEQLHCSIGVRGQRLLPGRKAFQPRPHG